MKKSSTREKLRRGWILILAAVIAIPLCFLFSRGKLQAGQHMEPGYTREEPGKWERTEARVIGPAGAGDRAVSASLDAGRLVYDFSVGEERARVTLETETPGECFYAGEHMEFELLMEREADSEQTPGDISCMFYLADAVAENENGAAISVRASFRYAYSGDRDMEPISYSNALVRKEKHYAVANTYFPEGHADGESLYIVMDVVDDRNAGVWTVLSWQYRWKQGPLTVEVPPQPGIIEYYRAFGPVNYVLRAAAYLLIAALLTLLVRQVVLAVRAKRENKR